MGEKKTKWEIKYEKYLSEEPVKDRIAEVERGIKNMNKYIDSTIGVRASKLKTKIEALKNEKVTGDFKTKEEYQEAVAKHQELIASKENELKELEEQSKTEKEQYASEQNKKLEGYKNFEKNKDKIKNILEYRNDLQKKLDALPKDTKTELENKKKEQEGRTSRIAQYQVEIENLKAQLKQDLPEGDRQILLLTLKTRMDSMGKLQAEQTITDREITDLELKGKGFDDKSASKKEIYERKIAKCNIIAANLLKGKNLGEFAIKVEPQDKKYTSSDNRLHDVIENVKDENVVEPIKDDNIVKEDAVNKDETENKEITKVSEFAQRHPRLAKIANFFKNIKNKIVNAFNDEEQEEFYINEEKVEDKVAEEIEKVEPVIEQKEVEQIQEMLQNRDENNLLKEIAEKGAEKTFRDRLAVNTKNAANNYAKRYGGNYERQDGAVKKGNER